MCIYLCLSIKNTYKRCISDIDCWTKWSSVFIFICRQGNMAFRVEHKLILKTYIKLILKLKLKGCIKNNRISLGEVILPLGKIYLLIIYLLGFQWLHIFICQPFRMNVITNIDYLLSNDKTK